MNKTKYWVALIGLAIGFFISFVLTSNYNKSNAGPPAGGLGTAGAGGAGAGGNQQAMMGQVQAVIETAKNNPQDARAQFEAARVFYQIGRTKDAIEYLRKAAEAEPNNINIAVNLGALSSEVKNYEEAEKWLKHASELDPKDPEIHIELGVTFIQREPPQPDRAIQEIQRALGIDPKSGHALGHLLEAYALKKDSRAAEETMKRLKEADPTNERIAKLEPVVADLKAGRAVTIPKE